jgi:hypothetical protein
MLIDREAEYSSGKDIILYAHLLWSKSEQLTSSAEIHVKMLEIMSGCPRETALSHNEDTLLQSGLCHNGLVLLFWTDAKGNRRPPFDF